MIESSLVELEERENNFSDDDSTTGRETAEIMNIVFGEQEYDSDIEGY